MKLRWQPDGRATTDGRYAIGVITSASGQSEFYLAESPLFVMEDREIQREPVVTGLVDEDGVPFRDDTITIPVVVRDEVPRPSADIEVVRQQAQAIEDGTLTEFEEARAVDLREFRARQAEKEAAVAAARAKALRAVADEGTGTPKLTKAQRDVLRREQQAG